MVRLTNHAARGAYRTVAGSSFGAQHTSEPAHPPNHLLVTVARWLAGHFSSVEGICVFTAFLNNEKYTKLALVVDVLRHRPMIRLTICIASHRRAGPMKRCVADAKVMLLIDHGLGWVRAPETTDLVEGGVVTEKRRTPKDTRKHHAQYNRQTTALHSHRPLASGCRRGMQLHRNVV